MNKIEQLYTDLQKEFGSPQDQWNLWCKRPKTLNDREEVIIGAILTQNTNWKNVSKAIANLKKAKALSLKKILELPDEKLKELIKPAGFYNSKSKYLRNVAEFIVSIGLKRLMTEELAPLREKLLKVKGVGRETADSILLYAMDKPIFVVDEYTRRICRSKKICLKMDYEHIRNLFEKNIKKDFALYQDFHALIVVHGKG
jgi:endonuclease-3 related protein